MAVTYARTVLKLLSCLYFKFKETTWLNPNYFMIFLPLFFCFSLFEYPCLDLWTVSINITPPPPEQTHI